MRKPRLWIFSIAAAVALSGLIGAYANNMLAAKPTAVGVVDIEGVFNNLKEKVQIEADLNAQQERLVKERQDKEKELKALQDELGIINPSNPGYREKEEKLGQKVFELQAWVQWQNNRLARENRLQIQQLYTKILSATAAVAQENGYDLVVYKEGTVDFSKVDPKQLSEAIRGRKVLYAAEAMELTEMVKTRMDNEYKNLVK
jgi:Skp family chaperone for outer membrane proteins